MGEYQCPHCGHIVSGFEHLEFELKQKAEQTAADTIAKLRAEIHLRQNGRCAICGMKLRVGQYEIDHIQALAHGGDNSVENLRAICMPCHRDKTRGDVQGLRKAERISVGGKQRKGRPLPGTKASGIRKRMSGAVEDW
jgi:5-methylcytosine-specific restriction enzyme A